jgi:O-antigen ligase
MNRVRVLVKGIRSRNFVIVALFSCLALFIGYYLPLVGPEFAAKVGTLLCVGIIFLSSALFPDDAKAPVRMIFSLLCLWMFCHTSVPAYVTYHLGVDLGLNRLVDWSLMFVAIYWVFASRSYREILVERVVDAQWWALVAFLWFDWKLVCSLFTDIEIFSLQFVLKGSLMGYLLVIITLGCVRNREDVERITRWCVVGAILASLIGLGEWKHQANLFRAFVPQTGDSAESVRWIVGENERDGAHRISSVFIHPLQFGEFLAMSLPLSLCCWQHAKNQWVRRAGLLALPLTAAGIYLAHTRSAILAAGVAVLLYCLLRFMIGFGLRGVRLAIMLILAMGVAVTPIVLGGGYVSEMVKGRTAGEQGSSYARVIMLRRGIEQVKESPIVGHGPGSAAYEIGRIAPGAGLTVDNQFLSEVVDCGIPGMCLFFLTLVIPMFRILREGMVPENIPWLCGYIAGLAAYVTTRPVLSLAFNGDLAMVYIAMIILLSGKAPNGNPFIDSVKLLPTGRA